MTKIAFGIRLISTLRTLLLYFFFGAFAVLLFTMVGLTNPSGPNALNFRIFVALGSLCLLVIVLESLWLMGARLSQRELWHYMPEWRFFLGRDYWGRTWIIQEIVLAKDLIVHCGDKSISWDELINPRIGHMKRSFGRVGTLPRSRLLTNAYAYSRLYDDSIVVLNSMRQSSRWH